MLLTSFYGQLETSKKRESWNLLARLSPNRQTAWCVSGDFNEITSQSEKQGGSQRSEAHMGSFCEALEVNGFFDLGYKGSKFTWYNHHVDSSFSKERLDQVVANGSWILKFKVHEVGSLVARTSDYSPLLLHMAEGSKGVMRRVRLF